MSHLPLSRMNGPRLLFSSFGCCISKGSFFTASNSPEMINKHISDKTQTWQINGKKKKSVMLTVTVDQAFCEI